MEHSLRPSALEPVLVQFRASMERLQVICREDPEAPGCDTRHAEFLAVIERTRRQLQALEQAVLTGEFPGSEVLPDRKVRVPSPAGDAVLADQPGTRNPKPEPSALPALRRRFQAELLAFLEGSENFRHTQIKPLGYAGDYRLMEMLASNTCTSRGLAWHFDRSQLDYPASEACRRRIEWISESVAARLEAQVASSEFRVSSAAPTRNPEPGTRNLAVLDLGIGAASVEQRLARNLPGLLLEVHAVDLEPAALDHVRHLLEPAGHRVHSWHLNLRDPAVMPVVSRLAAQVEVCLAIGLLEALTDPEAECLLHAVLTGLSPGSVCYTENFVPTHSTRSIMEWFQDFHLAYRSPEALRALACRAGANPARLELKLDSTASLALLKVEK